MIRGGSRGRAAEGPIEGCIEESAIMFDGQHRLFGMLTESAVCNDRCGTGIIIANAGSVHNVGPGRLYVELARTWAALGFSVLRVDVGGVGDSDTREGRADNHPYPDHAVQDLASAARWMVDHAGVRRVVIAGLCSGAHASFHAALQVHGIAGVVVINPIVFYWDPSCALDVSAWMNFYESRRYSRSVREVGAWVRLARGEVNVRHAAVVGYRRMREVVGGAAAGLWRRLGWRRAMQDDVPTDLERIGARGVDALLVFSEGDPGLDFVRRRHAREIRVLERRRSNFAMRVIPDADHTFTQREARERLAHLLTTHLVKRHRG
jgi:dienelactone hydrolase